VKWAWLMPIMLINGLEYEAIIKYVYKSSNNHKKLYRLDKTSKYMCNEIV
jgi:hypothetical protein